MKGGEVDEKSVEKSMCVALMVFSMSVVYLFFLGAKV